MTESVIVNTSPLIFLSGAELLDLLRMDGRDVVVPEPVWDELAQKGEADSTATTLAGVDWLRRVPAAPTSNAVLAWDLGPGEAAVISCALSMHGEVVIDDLLGRRCARSLGIPLRGTLGLVLRAVRRGLLPNARTVLEEMRSRGMWLSDAVIDRALRETGLE